MKRIKHHYRLKEKLIAKVDDANNVYQSTVEDVVPEISQWLQLANTMQGLANIKKSP
jgi:uncharacterized lipoprotein YajG